MSARAEQALLLSTFHLAAEYAVELTPADRRSAAEIAKRVAAAWKPDEPLMALYPAERDADGRIRWEVTGRWIEL